MTHAEALAQLRDIYGMDVTLWQWLMPYALGLLLLAAAVYGGWRRLRTHPPKPEHTSRIIAARLRATASLEPRAQAAALQELLKIHAIARHGRATIAPLHEASWLQWLDQHAATSHCHWPSDGKLLLRLPYQPHAATPEEITQLKRIQQAALAWVEQTP